MSDELKVYAFWALTTIGGALIVMIPLRLTRKSGEVSSGELSLPIVATVVWMVATKLEGIAGLSVAFKTMMNVFFEPILLQVAVVVLIFVRAFLLPKVVSSRHQAKLMLWVAVCGLAILFPIVIPSIGEKL